MNSKMKIYKFISGLIAFLSFLSLSYLFSGVGGEFDLAKLNPIEALEGIAFTFAFGFGLPILLSYIISILMLLSIPILIYCLVLGLLKRIIKQ